MDARNPEGGHTADHGTGRRPHEILLEVMGDARIPILADFDCCHTHPMLTMPIGCEIILDAARRQVLLMENPWIDSHNPKSIFPTGAVRALK